MSIILFIKKSLRATERCIRRDKVNGEDIEMTFAKNGLMEYADMTKSIFDSSKSARASRQKEKIESQSYSQQIVFKCKGCGNTIRDCTCDDV